MFAPIRYELEDLSFLRAPRQKHLHVVAECFHCAAVLFQPSCAIVMLSGTGSVGSILDEVKVVAPIRFGLEDVSLPRVPDKHHHCLCQTCPLR